MVLVKEVFKKVDFEKIRRKQKGMQNYPVGKELPLSPLVALRNINP